MMAVVQRAQTSVAAGAGFLTQIVEPYEHVADLIITRLWESSGVERGSYISDTATGEFRGGSVITNFGIRLPFTDLTAFIVALNMWGAHA